MVDLGARSMFDEQAALNLSSWPVKISSTSSARSRVMFVTKRLCSKPTKIKYSN